jgi:hypothetical protein
MDEYCEWSVTRRSSDNKITRVDFACENPEYWYTLWRISPETAAQIYQDTLNAGLPADSPNRITVTVEDLQLLDSLTGQPVIDPSTGHPAYNPLNKWNSGPVSVRGTSVPSGGVMHLTSTPNTLQTETGLAAAATVQRSSGNSNPQQLICCSQYGQPYRHSDPHIGQSVNQVVSAGPYLASLANPPGLYIQSPDFTAFELPNDPNLPADADVSECWHVVRGSAELTDSVTGDTFPGNFILHAVFQIPQRWIDAGVSFTVGDILIRFNGVSSPITWGAQITETFNIGLFARPIGSQQAPPALACVSSTPPAQTLAQPIQMMYEAIWNAYYKTPVQNPVGFAMNLASSTVIIPAIVVQGATGLTLVLTCSTATTGPNGELPAVSVEGGGITVQTLSMSTITYAAPGNSYPSQFQLLTLSVDVASGAPLGLANIYVTNYGQSQGPAGPAFFNVVSAIPS